MTTSIRPGNYGAAALPGFVNGGIRLATRSHWSHAYVVISDTQVVEAEWHGARIADLAEYAHVDVAYNVGESLTDEQRHIIVAKAVSLVGTPYNELDIAVLGLQALHIPVVHPLLKAAEDERRLMCSALVAACYAAAGIDLGLRDGRPSLPWALITPAHLADREGVEVWHGAP